MVGLVEIVGCIYFVNDFYLDDIICIIGFSGGNFGGRNDYYDDSVN